MAPGDQMGALAGIFRRKSVEQIQAEHAQGELKRTLGALNLVLLGIGCIIGTGIFVLTGRAAAEFSGPAITISFIITGLLCAFVALCYAELASALPVSGSAYSYTYASMGEVVAWVMGLLLLLEYGLAASTVAVGWSGYLVSLLHDLHLDIPAALTAAPGVEVKDAHGVVIAFIGIGSQYGNPKLWHPFIPPQVPAPPAGAPNDLLHQLGRALWAVLTGDNHARYGLQGVIQGAARIFFAYLGFEAVSTAGAESKNPSKDMPIGIIGSLVICTILYILTSGVLVGIVPYASLDNPAPIAMAVNQIGLPWFAIAVKIGAIAGLSSVMLVLLYGQTRIFYTMSRDGLLPTSLSRVHAKFKTPWINTIIVGIVACGAAGFLSLDALSDLSNVGSLAAFAMVCATVMYLRYARPQMIRPFKTPLFPVVPILGVVMCLILLLSIMANHDTRNFFLIYLVVGIVIYFAYGMRHSRLRLGVRVEGHEATPMEPPHAGD